MNILKKGDAGSDVALLQKGLARAGQEVDIDGVFGPQTERALTAFQRSRGLAPDGIYGPRTERALAPWLLGYAVHTVARGDTLWRIADRYGATLLALETANPDLDPFDLRPGQRLTVPFAFPVVPAEVPCSSELVSYCVRGLAARYPLLRLGDVGRSVMGKPLYRLTLGEGSRRVLYNAAHHANEWITTLLLLRFAEELLGAYAAGGSLFGVSAEELWNLSEITLIPAVDPDGIDLVTGALRSGEYFEGARRLALGYPAIPFPSGWKANIRGVDLNLQYPAQWKQAQRIKAELGYTAPGPENYVGTAPLTEPESRAMYAYTQELAPELVLAYHTQGQVIYWKFLDIEPPGGQALAERFAAVSGYAYEQTPFASGFAGYKDWFIQDYDLPGFTVEAGLGQNPLPLSQLEQIWRDNRGILVLAALG